MVTRSSYIMRDQVRDFVPSLMEYDVTRGSSRSDKGVYLLSVGVVSFVYLLAMALSTG
jgi:hypothetical protein